MMFEQLGGVVTEAGPHLQVYVIDGQIYLTEASGIEWPLTKDECRRLRNALSRAERRLP